MPHPRKQVFEMGRQLVSVTREAEEAFAPFEAGPYSVSDTSGRSITVVGDDGVICGMVVLPSSRGLAKPRGGRWHSCDVVDEAERTPVGHPHFISTGRPDFLAHRIGGRSAPGPGESELIATIDTSVLRAGSTHPSSASEKRSSFPKRWNWKCRS